MDECKKHSGIEAKIENLEHSDSEQWKAIKALQNRLPVWATLLISLLTFLLGGTLSYAALNHG